MISQEGRRTLSYAIAVHRGQKQAYLGHSTLEIRNTKFVIMTYDN
jgi:hypothetical protein